MSYRKRSGYTVVRPGASSSKRPAITFDSSEETQPLDEGDYDGTQAKRQNSQDLDELDLSFLDDIDAG